MDSDPRTLPDPPHPLRPPLTRGIRLLLDSRIPARLAWVAPTGAPRVAALWFVWDAPEVVMSTFAGSAKLRDIATGDRVSMSIDTEDFPYRTLRLGGRVTVQPVPGLSDAYRRAAARYLGPAAGAEWCDELAGREQVEIRLRPSWASHTDMTRSPFLGEAPAS